MVLLSLSEDALTNRGRHLLPLCGLLLTLPLRTAARSPTTAEPKAPYPEC